MKRKFKPFDKVLVRDKIEHKWQIELFGRYSTADPFMQFICLNGAYRFCIPYEGNEHLLGTTDDYVEPFEPNDGDFVRVLGGDGFEYISIFKSCIDGVIKGYSTLSKRGEKPYVHAQSNVFLKGASILGLATEGEKQELLDTLHKEGKDWDAEKKEIVDCKWKPKEGEEYFFPCFDGDDFYPEIDRWRDDVNSNNGFDKGWVISSEEECQALCDKLNEAIKNVK